MQIVPAGAQCRGKLEAGTYSGNALDITQHGSQIVVKLLRNCTRCQLAGTIAADGRFTAKADEGGGEVRLTGQVTGDSMSASRIAVDVDFDCTPSSEYALTRQ